MHEKPENVIIVPTKRYKMREGIITNQNITAGIYCGMKVVKARQEAYSRVVLISDSDACWQAVTQSTLSQF